jgi:hypothetical protein
MIEARLIFAPQDFWVGASWDRRQRTLYVMLLPMLGIALHLGGLAHG